MLLKHSFFYLAAIGLPGIVNLLALVIYTRLLSPEEYGQYALVVAGVGLASAVIFRWLNLGLLRFITAYQGRQEVFLSTVAAGFIGMMVLSGLFCAFCLFFIVNSQLRSLWVIGLVLLWLQAFFDLNQELARTQFSPARYGLLALIKAVAALIIGGLLAYIGWGAFGLFFGLMAGSISAALWVLKKEWRAVRFRLVDRELMNQLCTYGLPLTATFALGFVVNSSDRFLLGWLLSTETAGLYSVGYDLAKNSLGIFMMVVNLAAYPLAVRALEQKGIAAAQEQLCQNATMLIAVGLPVTSGFALLSPNIAAAFLGPEFRGYAADLMPWVIFGALLAGIKSYYFDLSFQLGRRTIMQVWVTLAAAVLNVALNFWWIPFFGIMGAAYSTVAAFALSLVMSWGLGRRVFPLLFPTGDFFKIALATAVMIFVLAPFRDLYGNWILAGQLFMGSLIFGAMACFLDVGGIRSKSFQIFNEIRRYR